MQQNADVGNKKAIIVNIFAYLKYIIISKYTVHYAKVFNEDEYTQGFKNIPQLHLQVSLY